MEANGAMEISLDEGDGGETLLCESGGIVSGNGITSIPVDVNDPVQMSALGLKEEDVDIVNNLKPGETFVFKSSSGSSNSDDQKVQANDEDYQPDVEESDGEDFVNNPPKKRKRAGGNHGTIKRPLADEEFGRRMEEIREYLVSGQLPFFPTAQDKARFIAKCKCYFMKEDKLMFQKARKGKPPIDLECVWDPNRQMDIMRSVHGGAGVSKQSQALGGHMGTNTMRSHVAARFYWPRLT